MATAEKKNERGEGNQWNYRITDDRIRKKEMKNKGEISKRKIDCMIDFMTVQHINYKTLHVTIRNYEHCNFMPWIKYLRQPEKGRARHLEDCCSDDKGDKGNGSEAQEARKDVRTRENILHAFTDMHLCALFDFPPRTCFSPHLPSHRVTWARRQVFAGTWTTCPRHLPVRPLPTLRRVLCLLLFFEESR